MAAGTDVPSPVPEQCYQNERGASCSQRLVCGTSDIERLRTAMVVLPEGGPCARRRGTSPRRVCHDSNGNREKEKKWPG